MAWVYRGAAFHGNKGKPNSGDRVEVLLQNADDPKKVIQETMQWTFDEGDGFSKVQFRTMVKDQIRQRLAALNVRRPAVNATQDYDPGSNS